MSIVKLGNGQILKTCLETEPFHPACECDTNGLAKILEVLQMTGSNLHGLYNGLKCKHNNPASVSSLLSELQIHYGEDVKVYGQADIQEWLRTTMKNSVALVYFSFTISGRFGWFDLYLGDKLWKRQSLSGAASEMWIWVIPGYKPPKKHHRHHHHHHKSRHKTPIVF